MGAIPGLASFRAGQAGGRPPGWRAPARRTCGCDTNSLPSTDGVMVHSKYQLYRKQLLEAGLELYEINPTAGALHERRAGSFHGPSGSGSASFTEDIRLRPTDWLYRLLQCRSALEQT